MENSFSLLCRLNLLKCISSMDCRGRSIVEIVRVPKCRRAGKLPSATVYRRTVSQRRRRGGGRAIYSTPVATASWDPPTPTSFVIYQCGRKVICPSGNTYSTERGFLFVTRFCNVATCGLQRASQGISWENFPQHDLQTLRQMGRPAV